jgi:hypothetical protein
VLSRVAYFALKEFFIFFSLSFFLVDFMVYSNTQLSAFSTLADRLWNEKTYLWRVFVYPLRLSGLKRVKWKVKFFFAFKQPFKQFCFKNLSQSKQTKAIKQQRNLAGRVMCENERRNLFTRVIKRFLQTKDMKFCHICRVSCSDVA